MFNVAELNRFDFAQLNSRQLAYVRVQLCREMGRIAQLRHQLQSDQLHEAYTANELASDECTSYMIAVSLELHRRPDWTIGSMARDLLRELRFPLRFMGEQPQLEPADSQAVLQNEQLGEIIPFPVPITSPVPGRVAMASEMQNLAS